ncbi:MAG: hypothetical protein QOH42_1962 [Blastocatellia bacterium]|nr:hypothetical protein [Blastocatellia bacterium]
MAAVKDGGKCGFAAAPGGKAQPFRRPTLLLTVEYASDPEAEPLNCLGMNAGKPEAYLYVLRQSRKIGPARTLRRSLMT